jgi:hypothetical protein
MSPLRRQAQAGRLHGAVIPLVIALLMGALFAWQMMRERAAHSAPAHAKASPAPGVNPWAPTGPKGTADPAKQDQRQWLASQLAAARQRLDTYRAATRYPPESRPMAEHPDQLKPFDPVAESRPALTAQGEPIAGRHLMSSQDRVHVNGQDSVLFTLALQDDQGHAAPLRVIRAMAHEVQDSAHPQTVTQSAVQFEDRGSNGDALANDGTYSARLKPAAQGFDATQGTLRVDVDYQSDTGGVAHMFFDIIYMPNVPATWSGGVRESLENGSLTFYLKADVREAGRYVVNARAYDANGKPFALLSFNDEVPTGPTEFRLALFGKLVRDAKPVFPITLRDVDGFVLYESRFPDRAMMPRRPQVAYTSAPHSASDFSDAEWSGDTRQRYLTEYTKDVDLAQQNLQQASP